MLAEPVTHGALERIDPRPFVKYAGGKRSLLPVLMERIPHKFGAYHEPFVGGGALFFELMAKQRVRFRAFISDTNAPLIRTYKAIRNDVDGLVESLCRHKNTEAHFKKTRALRPETMVESEAAARFIYLNKTCFNGLYRVNRNGDFNVPFGRYKNPPICDEANLRAVHRALNRGSVRVEARPFETVLRYAKPGDLAYFDPPYLPLKEEFTSYGAAGFGYADHVLLRDVALELKKRKVHVLVSNSGADRVRALYAKGFRVEEVSGARSVSASGEARGAKVDLLIR